MQENRDMKVYPYKNQLPVVANGVYIDESAKVMGNVIIGKDSSIWSMVSIRGDVNRIEIGERTNIQDACVLHGSPDCDFYPGGFPVLIGSNVTVGHGAILHGCKIQDSCLIGIGAIILDGAELGEGLIIAAGSLVPPNKKLESGYLYVGSPVKKIRELSEMEKLHLNYSADSYVQLKNDLTE